jgi:bifunctional non-homologous end joining protein LigD
MARKAAAEKLAKYQTMRDFTRTAEPSGSEEPSDGAASRAKREGPQAKKPKAESALSYVIQKHAASHLHYDFRLELDGVLLSWAVPKGPSLDPSVKRLAMEVEPHPLEYAKFEGTIPKGEYGGGTVMVWDRGTWTPEKDAHRAVAAGRLSFELDGEKLHGAWHLVRAGGSKNNGHGKDGRSWLLFKSRDEYAKTGKAADLPDEQNSVLTGRSLEEIADGRPAKPGSERAKRRKAELDPVERQTVWRSNRAAASTDESADPERKPSASKKPASKKPSSKKPASKKPSSRELRAIEGAAARELPATAEPELATLVDSAPEGDDWVHEIKFDGYRLLARFDGREVQLLTRNGKDWTKRMPAVASALTELGVSEALIDGELVVLNERGISDFQTLQNSLSEGTTATLTYYAFDLLHLDGTDLTGASLAERKKLLRQVLETLPEAARATIRLSEHVRGNGPEFFQKAGELGLEGIISKRERSTYRAGRGHDWLKVKCVAEQEFVVVGFTDPRGSRGHLGALLVATHEGKKLTYAGKVGTGFSAKSLKDLFSRLKPLARKTPAVDNPPRGADARGVHWVEPKLVAEVSFTGFTDDGLLRHPSFRGLREDKPARAVHLERPAPVPKQVTAGDKPAAAQVKPKAKATASSRVRVTNPDKVLYPEAGIRKGELFDYYTMVAERMLPHVANRPLVLVRCPNGHTQHCFFQKHPGKGTPDTLRSIEIVESDGPAEYSVLDDLDGLLALPQLGALEIHTWGSRADDPERPDILVFDLDPDPAVGWPSVVACANRLRSLFESVKLESFVKSTGGKGLHVCVPVEPDLDWEVIKPFCERVAEELVGESPDKYVSTVSKAKRRGKIFIDYLRNGRGATFIAPYSTRARPNCPVAVPLDWDELAALPKPDFYTLRNLEDRLSKLKKDPFERLVLVKQRLRP